jgi:hypothetical protein
MRFMVMVPANADSEAGTLPDEKMFLEMTKYNEQLVKAGVMLAGEGLHPPTRGARITFNGAKRSVVDGPFTEAKELIAGYWIWQVKSKEEAIEWAKRAPFADGVTLELRQVYESTEMGASDEIVEREQKMRKELASHQDPRPRPDHLPADGPRRS